MATNTTTTTAQPKPKGLVETAKFISDPVKFENDKRKQECVARGGKWDGTKCIMPTEIPNQTETEAPKQPSGSFSKEKGGFTTNTGQTFPTTNPDFVPGQPGTNTQIKFNQNGSIDYTPKGSSEAITLTREEYNVLQGKAGNVTNKVQQAQTQVPQQVVNQPLTEEQLSRNVVPQEPIAEVVQTGAGALSGALAVGGTGAALGSLAGPVGTVIGAVGGGILGAIGGAYTKIGIDKRGDVKQAFTVGKVENTNFGQLIDYVNAGGDPVIARQRFNESKANLYASQRFLKEQTSSELNRFLSEGADEAAKIDDYIADLENYYEPEFNTAILNPTGKVKYGVTSVNPAIEAE